MLKRFINDLISGLWVVFGLTFALVALPSGSETQSTMTALFLGLTVIWIVTGPLRWKDGN
jgi:hypothetical protein